MEELQTDETSLHGENILPCDFLNMMILHTGLFKLQADII